MPALKASVEHIGARIERDLMEPMKKKEQAIEEGGACARIPG